MRKTIVILVLTMLIFPGNVLAHRPIFVQVEASAEDPVTISAPDISWAIYADLKAGDVDYYEFQVPEQGLDFFAQLLVPTRPEYKDFRPVLALIGQDLPQVDAKELPISLPPEAGVLILPWQDKEIFFEPFTQTRYYMAEEMRRKLRAGTWQLAIYHPQGKRGKYTLAVGEREKWGWQEALAFPGIWFRTRWWYSPGQTIAILGAMLAALVLVFWLFKRKLGK